MKKNQKNQKSQKQRRPSNAELIEKGICPKCYWHMENMKGFLDKLCTVCQIRWHFVDTGAGYYEGHSLDKKSGERVKKLEGVYSTYKEKTHGS